MKISKPATPKGWKLPGGDRVKFRVTKNPLVHADIIYDDKKPVTEFLIRVSSAKNGHTNTVLATLGHEMIHIRQILVGDSGNHNAFFKRAAARVCRVHGFDPQTF